MTKKVLHILHEIKYSGAEIMLNLAAPYFIGQGVEMHVVSSDDNLGEYAPILQQSGFITHHVPFQPSLSHFKQFYRFLQQGKFDAVHIHTEQTFFWFALLTRMAGVNKTLYTIHNVFTYTGLVRLKRSFYRKTAGSLFRLQYTAIGTSVAHVERTCLYNSTILVPNWIDQTKFFPAQNTSEKSVNRQKLDIADTQLVIVSVGSCSPQKNHRDIIQAVASLREEFPDILYIHIGDGPLCGEEKAYAEQLNVHGHIRFLGQLQHVREVLIASDIFVMPSHYEGLPIALFEALSCGLPAIGYNVYGVKDLIEDGINGFLVAADPASLANKISQLAHDPSLREKMGNAAHTKVTMNYDMHTSLRKLMQLYGFEPVHTVKYPL